MGAFYVLKKVFALFLLFTLIENLCSLGRTSTGAERIDIREHRSAGLTKNARVCLHAESVLLGAFSYILDQLTIFV
ncbi:hypothetical protein VL05_03835 [Bacillus stratosphericus]|nr:hypothetical protein VL05_03835 [Bacillus stratosphericus]